MKKLSQILLILCALLLVSGFTLRGDLSVYADEETPTEEVTEQKNETSEIPNSSENTETTDETFAVDPEMGGTEYVETDETTGETEDFNYVSQKLSIVDENGNLIEDLDDTISIGRVEEQNGSDSLIYVPIYKLDGKETRSEEAYDLNDSYSELDIASGTIELNGLREGETYIVLFDNNYVFKSIRANEGGEDITTYHMYASFVAGETEEISIYSNQFVEYWTLTDEEIASIAGTEDIMLLAETTYFRGQCSSTSNTVQVYVTNGLTCNDHTTYRSCGSVSGNGTINCTPTYCSSSVYQFNYKLVSSNGKETTGNTSAGSSVPIYCDAFGTTSGGGGSGGGDTGGGGSGGGDTGPDYTTGASCSEKWEVSTEGCASTQKIDANGGRCDRDERHSQRECTSALKWSACYWDWNGDNGGCTREGSNATYTVTYNDNVQAGSSSTSSFGGTPGSTYTQQVNYSVEYTFNGFGDEVDGTVYAQWTETQSGSTSTTTPDIIRYGYTFKGWSTDPNASSGIGANTAINVTGDITYYAIWEANTYTYTINYVSSSGKALGSTEATFAFDSTNTISAPAISGYTTPANQSVKWDVPNNYGKTITFTYPIVTYNIWYDLNTPAGSTNGVNASSNPSTYNVETPTITLANPTRVGYTFKGWYSNISYTAASNTIPTGSTGNKAFYAQWTANQYDLRVKNVNDRVSITVSIEGKNYTLASGQTQTVKVNFDDYYTVKSGSTNPSYYTSYTQSDSNANHRMSTVKDGTPTGEDVLINASRNYKTFTTTLKNDNGYAVTDTITLKVLDNVDGKEIDNVATELTGDLKSSTITKTGTVNANSTSTVTFNIPENTSLEISATNNAQTTGYALSTTGLTKDYNTIVETPNMYASKEDYERTSYREELDKSYVVFTTFDNALSDYKGTTYPEMIIDNQYLKASYAYTSENSVSVKLYECLSEACTTSWTVQETEHDSNNNYYATAVSNEVSGESKYLATLSGTSNTFANVDRYKTYKIVQESLVKDRYYSWDSGYTITTNDYSGYGTGAGTIDLNKMAKAYKIDVFGKTYDAAFSGSTITTGKAGSLVTSNLRQPYTEVSIKATTSSGVPVAGVELYFGAKTNTKEAYQNIYVAAPTTKQGITFKSGGTSGKALQPDMDYSGYLGGSWVTDLSGEYAPYNGYLANESWYDTSELNIAHYQREDESAYELDMIIKTAPLTLRAKTDIGNLNAAFNVNVNNTAYYYGDEDQNGEMLKSNSTIVMHLGSKEYDKCSSERSVGKVCKADDGYYEYTIDVPVDKLITVKNINTGLYYDVKQTCDVDLDKYACRSYVPESEDDAVVETFDFTRQTANVKVESILENVQLDRNVINTVTFTVKDTQNNDAPCDATKYPYCAAWSGDDDLTTWTNADFKKSGDNTYTYTFELNPKTNQKDSTVIKLPAGVEFTVTAKVKLEQTDNWIANFINGIYGLTGSDKYNSGYHTYVTNANGIAQKGDDNLVTLTTNDYEYARINVKSNTTAKFGVYDKNNTEVNTFAFGSAGTHSVDAEYESSPYTIKQINSVAGYYFAKDVTIDNMAKDGTYDVDMTQEEINTIINVVANINGTETPITNISFAIGEDANNIIYSGTISEINQLIGKEAKLEAGKTYKVYVGGELNDTTITGYYGVGEVEVPKNYPGEDLNVKVTVGYIPEDPTPITQSHRVTVNYVFEDGRTASKSNSLTVDEGKTYTIVSPSIEGYTADKDVVEGTMGTSDETITVTYKANSTPAPTPVPATSHTITVKYVYEDGKTARPSNTLKVDEGKTYTIVSPTIEGYTYDKETVSGTMGSEDITETVTYKKNGGTVTPTPTDPTPEEIKEFVKRTIETNKLTETRSLTTHVTITLSDPWTYGDFVNGVYEFDLKDGESLDTYLPTFTIDGKKGMTYSVEVSNTFGYDTVITDTANFTVSDENDHIIHIENTPKEFVLEISGSNSVFKEVKVEGVKYTVYNGDDCETVEAKEPIFTHVLPTEPKQDDYADEAAYKRAYKRYAVLKAEYDNAYSNYQKEHAYWENHKTTKSCKVIATSETDVNGRVSFDLEYGLNYYVEQTETVYGYKPDKDENGLLKQYTVELPNTFDFDRDTYELVIDNNPYVYKVEITKKDDSGNTVEGVEYTVKDETTGTTPIKEAVAKPVDKTDEDGKVDFDLTYGHEYSITETDTPDGYEKPDACKIDKEAEGCEKTPLPNPKDEDKKIDEDDTPIEIEDEHTEKGLNFLVNVKGYDAKTNKPIKASYILKEVTTDTELSMIENNTEGTLTGKYSQKHSWVVIPVAPEGYSTPANQTVVLSFNEDGTIKETDLTFKFVPLEFNTNVETKDKDNGEDIDAGYKVVDKDTGETCAILEKGKGTMTCDYSQDHEYEIIVDTPDGYKPIDPKDVDIEFNDDGTIKDIDMTIELEPYEFIVKVKGYDAKTNENIKASYTLKDTTKNDKLDDLDGDGQMKAKYHQNHTFTVIPKAPNGYKETDSQTIKFTFNEDGSIKDTDLEFRFEPMKFNVNVDSKDEKTDDDIDSGYKIVDKTTGETCDVLNEGKGTMGNCDYSQDHDYEVIIDTPDGYKPVDPKDIDIDFNDDGTIKDIDLVIEYKPYDFTVIVNGVDSTTGQELELRYYLHNNTKDEDTKTRKGDGKLTDTYSQNYTWSVNADPIDGYRKPEAQQVTFEFNEDGSIKDVHITFKMEAYNFNVNVSGIDKRTGKTVDTKYHLYNEVLQKDSASREKDGPMTTAYSISYKWHISAEAPYGYKAASDQNVTFSFREDGSIIDGYYKFEFEPQGLAVNVINTIKGDTVELYDSNNNLVQTKKADGNITTLDNMVFGEYYTVKVKHPTGYYVDNTVYDVKLPAGAPFKDGYAWCEDIYLKKPTKINTEKNLYGVKIKVVDEDDNPIKGVKVGIYNKQNKLVSDIYGSDATGTTDSKGTTTLYIYSGVGSIVKEIEVPEQYELIADGQSYTVKYVATTADKLQGYVEITFKNSASEEYKKIIEKVDNIIKDNDDKCKEAKAKLEELYNSYDKSSYSSETWAKIEQIFADARSRLDSSDACTLDKDSLLDKLKDGDDFTIFDYETFIASITAQIDALKDGAKTTGTHWWHWVIIVISIIAIIFNIVTKKFSLNLIVALITLLFDVITAILIDLCLYSIIATLVFLLIQLVILLIRMFKDKDDDDNDNDNPNEPKEEQKVKEKVIDLTPKPKKVKEEKSEKVKEPMFKKKQKAPKPVKEESVDIPMENYEYNDKDVKDFIDETSKDSDSFLKKYQN